MVAWKSLYEVFTPLCETSLFMPYTRLGQPIDGTHACRHDKHAENPTVNVHSTVDD